MSNTDKPSFSTGTVQTSAIHPSPPRPGGFQFGDGSRNPRGMRYLLDQEFGISWRICLDVLEILSDFLAHFSKHPLASFSYSNIMEISHDISWYLDDYLQIDYLMISYFHLWSPISCHFRYFKRWFQRPTLRCGELHRDARLPRDARNVCWGSDPSSTNLPKCSNHWHLGTTSWDFNWSGTAGSNSGSNGGWNIMKHPERWWKMKHHERWKNVRTAQCPIPILQKKHVFQVQNHQKSLGRGLPDSRAASGSALPAPRNSTGIGPRRECRCVDICNTTGDASRTVWTSDGNNLGIWIWMAVEVWLKVWLGMAWYRLEVDYIGLGLSWNS